MGPVAWFPKQTKLAIKHQDHTWLVARSVSQMLPVLLDSYHRCPMSGTAAKESGRFAECGYAKRLWRMMKEYLLWFSSDLWAVSRHTFGDGQQVLLEDLQPGERRSLVCSNLAGLPVQLDARQGMLPTSIPDCSSTC